MFAQKLGRPGHAVKSGETEPVKISLKDCLACRYISTLLSYPVYFYSR